MNDILASTLTELGIPVPSNAVQTMLMKDRYFVGWKFRYDGGYAVFFQEKSTIKLFDEQANLLKSIAVESAKKAAA